MQHLQFGDSLPNDIEIPFAVRWQPPGPRKGIYEWELALLAKELLVLAPEVGTTDFRSWTCFASAINKLKNLDNDISGRYAELYKNNILIELNRLSHHQFWWQRSLRLDSEVTRYFKIFGYPPVDAIVQRRLGMNAHALYCIGLAVSGHFLQSSELILPWSHDLPSVTQEQIGKFFDLFTRPLSQMRDLCKEVQSFDENFIYGFNPLTQFPLVRFNSGGTTRFVAPVLRYLIKRYTDGIYYEVVGAPGLDSALGESFQVYVGDVLGAVNSRKTLTILPEVEYSVGRDVKRSVDWIVSDSTGNLFIECKTKRLRLDAKTALSDLTPLSADLEKLAEFVVQVYRTLKDALDGLYPHWSRGDRPVYPLVTTLEEWYVFGKRFDTELESRIREAFAKENIDSSYMDLYPLTICSVGELERLVSLIATKGVQTVMAEKTNDKRRLWLVHGALLDAFPEDFPKTRKNLFPEVLDTITG